MTCPTCHQEICRNEPPKKFKILQSVTKYTEYIVESPSEEEALIWNWKILKTEEKHGFSKIEKCEEIK